MRLGTQALKNRPDKVSRHATGVSATVVAMKASQTKACRLAPLSSSIVCEVPFLDRPDSQVLLGDKPVVLVAYVAESGSKQLSGSGGFFGLR
jgi:hypothetical protein